MNKIEEAFIRANYKNLKDEELAELYNKTFNKTIGKKTIEYYRKKLNLKKKGSKRLKVGTELLRENGFVYMKVAEPDVWRYKHRWIYEQAYGEIPKGYIVIFLDGDKTNFSLDNLALVKSEVGLLMRKQKLIFNSKELTKAGLMIAELQAKVLKIEKPDNYNELSLKEKKRVRDLNYYYRNKEKITAYRKEQRKNQKEKNNAYMRKYREKQKNIVNNDTTS